MVFVVEAIGRFWSAGEGPLRLVGGGDGREGVYAAHTGVQGWLGVGVL